MKKKEFGDFQTPMALSRQICALLARQGISPATIVEPTCGQGSFIFASLEHFPQATTFFGVDINDNYVASVRQELNRQNLGNKVEIEQADFFSLDWPAILTAFPDPILIIGNPPWVTNSMLGSLESQNLPQKTNFQSHTGLDALTGKSNFDISEWILIRLIQAIKDRDGIVAMLIKTSVARKVLKYLWENNIAPKAAQLYLLDAKQEFGVSVDMGLLVCHSTNNVESQTCNVYNGLHEEKLRTTFGFTAGQLVAQVNYYHRWQHLKATTETNYKWRSGIKHDAAKVMELTKQATCYKNQLGERYALEDDYLYPLLKSSDIAKQQVKEPRRWVLIPQTYVGETTSPIRHHAPQTWTYLQKHKPFFERRKSSIYKNKPMFSIFGVGEYSFSPWKVAISGLYKNIQFTVIEPYHNKPVMLDDTCYFITGQSNDEVKFLAKLLNSTIAKEFFSSFIFWDSKRPITANILSHLDISLLAQELGFAETFQQYRPPVNAKQLSFIC